MQGVLRRLRAGRALRVPERGEILLSQRRIFILPTAAGLVYGCVLLLMLVGSVNYDLALGLALTFLLASLGMTALLHTFRNLARLRVLPARTAPVFAGETARFCVAIRNPGATRRHSIGVRRDRREVELVDVPPDGVAVAGVPVPAQRRGRLRPGRFVLFTRFPLGLFNAWASVELDTECVVYPRPAPPGLPLPLPCMQRAEGLHPGDAHDDFVGLREYQPGDSPRHVAWKALARGHPLLTKQFAGGSTGEFWFMLDALPRDLGLEDRLSQLARWVLDAHAQGLAYGLALPGTRVPVGTGATHRDRCLEALALYELPAAHAAAGGATGHPP